MQLLHDQARFDSQADPCKGDGSAARAPAIVFVGFSLTLLQAAACISVKDTGTKQNRTRPATTY